MIHSHLIFYPQTTPLVTEDKQKDEDVAEGNEELGGVMVVQLLVQKPTVLYRDIIEATVALLPLGQHHRIQYPQLINLVLQNQTIRDSLLAQPKLCLPTTVRSPRVVMMLARVRLPQLLHPKSSVTGLLIEMPQKVPRMLYGMGRVAVSLTRKRRNHKILVLLKKNS